MVCFVIDSEPSDSGVIMVSLMMRMMMMRKRGRIRMRRRMAKVCEGERRADW